MKLSYFIIPLVVVLVALVGSLLTGVGMPWYETLARPSFTPDGSVIGAVWTIIFILSGISALLFWNKKNQKHSAAITVMFVANAVLNVLWSWLFFVRYQIGWSIIEMIVLNITNVVLIVLLWKQHRISAALLIPYFAWVFFATYLAYQIWTLNP